MHTRSSVTMLEAITPAQAAFVSQKGVRNKGSRHEWHCHAFFVIARRYWRTGCADTLACLKKYAEHADLAIFLLLPRPSLA
jgi:hypothetical protein